MKTDL